MGRRSDHTASELTALILEAAQKIVVDEGVDHLSMRRVAGAIGYTPGTIYQHFDGMAGIMNRMNTRTLTALEDEIRKSVPDSDPRRRLQDYADIYLDFITRNDRLWTALFETRRSADEVVPDWYRERIDGLIGLLADCFDAMGPGLRTPRRAAELLWSSAHAVCSLDAAGKLPLISGQTLTDLVHELVEIHITAFGSAEPGTHKTTSGPQRSIQNGR